VEEEKKLFSREKRRGEERGRQGAESTRGQGQPIALQRTLTERRRRKRRPHPRKTLKRRKKGDQIVWGNQAGDTIERIEKAKTLDRERLRVVKAQFHRLHIIFTMVYWGTLRRDAGNEGRERGPRGSCRIHRPLSSPQKNTEEIRPEKQKKKESNRGTALYSPTRGPGRLLAWQKEQRPYLSRDARNVFSKGGREVQLKTSSMSLEESTFRELGRISSVPARGTVSRAGA